MKIFQKITCMAFKENERKAKDVIWNYIGENYKKSISLNIFVLHLEALVHTKKAIILKFGKQRGSYQV